MIPFIIFLVFVVIALLFIALSFLISKNEKSIKLDYSVECETKVVQSLKSILNKNCVFNSLYFPVQKDGELLWTEVDAVCITRGGICVFEIKGLKGNIINPDGPKWIQEHRDKHLEFQNPYIQNNGHIIALKNVLKSKDLETLPIYNFVVFTSENVKFSNQYNWLLKFDQVIDVITNLDDKNVLSSSQIKEIKKMLVKYKTKHKPTAAINHS